MFSDYRVAAFAALILAASAVSAQSLSPAEKKLVQSVEKHLDEESAAFQKVVDIDSGTLNTIGVQEVGRYFLKELQDLGFQARWVSMPDAMKRGGHLVAEHIAPKSRGKRVLLIGHLDTVFEGKGHRFERAGDLVKGAGVSDMKGGDIVLLYALKALKDSRLLDDATIRVVLTGDEESPGLPLEVSRRDLREAAHQSDIALSFEPDTGKIALGRRGLSTWVLQVTGAQGHSAYVLHNGGAGAVYEAARILDGIRAAFAAHPSTTINPGLILGGTDVSYDADKSAGTSAGKFNIVAKGATVLGDVRCLSPKDLEQAKAKILEIASASLPKTSAHISFEDVFLGWPVTEGNRDALRFLGVVSKDLGQGPLEADDPAQRGAGDFGYIGSIVNGADGLGIRGQGFHSPEESADLRSLGPSTSRAAVAIARLVRGAQ